MRENLTCARRQVQFYTDFLFGAASRDCPTTMLRGASRPPVRAPALPSPLRAAIAAPRRYLSIATPQISLGGPARLVAPVLDLTFSAVSSALQRKWSFYPTYEHFESITAAARPQVTKSLSDVSSSIPLHLLAAAAAVLRTCASLHLKLTLQ